MQKSPRFIIGVAILFLIATSFFLDQFDLYDKISHLDKILHVFGGAIAGWFFVNYFQKDFAQSESKWNYLLAVAGAAMLVGVFWEFAERLSTLYGSPLMRHYFYGLDLDDTLMDLTADLAGAVAIQQFFVWRVR
ncbi:MAG: hypothetical protein A3I39_01285 [Candidatus Yanofskybacteria bacterium RIFCSPLOWO2_02_FULL_47_9b]|uniref:VanZ-like domain-containing protein n=1 Tax=Candidatus Yanofskybacteria bacterium RIFCSPLOWO2_02_FULL_47_9b TaxID=1802708 RepID=A0A1F8HBH8_9BACT|nr:MAG: hypothetical protein A3I39_01285 [Candidatus Yanofskybacteria bacterium RIFCSPLOWO2_02_FULL_47_9b]